MDTPAGHERNADQIAYWNGQGGQHWTDRQQTQDIVLAPISELLLHRAKPMPGEQAIDIGCGCGATTIALAARVGPSGRVVGIDISAPMLTRANVVAPKDAPIAFVLADATVHPFEPAKFDLLVSRFGVMFFADPALSFGNMRKALRAGGRVAFACWREPRDNPWLMTPLHAAYRHVPKLPQLGPEDPGPFAFASEPRVRHVLAEAGFLEIAMERCDLSLDVAAGGGIEAALQAALEIGPASRALEGQPPPLRDAAIESIRAALEPFAKGSAVLLGASVWIVAARAP